MLRRTILLERISVKIGNLAKIGHPSPTWSVHSKPSGNPERFDLVPYLEILKIASRNTKNRDFALMGQTIIY